MGVTEGGEMESSGDEGGGTRHNDKPGRSKDKVLKMGIQKGGDAGRVKRGSGGNDKPGGNDGNGGSRYDDEGEMSGEAGGGVRLATVANPLCMRRWKPGKEKDVTGSVRVVHSICKDISRLERAILS